MHGASWAGFACRADFDNERQCSGTTSADQMGAMKLVFSIRLGWWEGSFFIRNMPYLACPDPLMIIIIYTHHDTASSLHIKIYVIQATHVLQLLITFNCDPQQFLSTSLSKLMLIICLWQCAKGHCLWQTNQHTRQTSNIRRTLVGNKLVDHPDVVGASPVGAAPTTSAFSTEHMASMYWAETATGRDENQLSLGIRCVLY